MDWEQISLRAVQKKDYPYIEEIIRKTWHYDQLGGSPKDAGHMARLYLRSCLQRATFSRVAVVDGRVLGAILADSKNAKRKGALRRTLAQWWAAALLFTTKTGRKIGRFFQVFEQADRELLAESHRSFDAEICFFAVDESARGTGLGKKLFSVALDDLREKGAKDFYLFTDTSCTYSFYEKRGMRRLGEKVVSCAPYIRYKLHMFLYGDSLQTENR